MADPYPFKGIWRWAVLPTLLALAGLLGGLAGGLAGQAAMSDFGWWLIPGLVKALAEGAALAVGRRPLVALIAAMVLGGLSVGGEYGLFAATYGTRGPSDYRVGTIVVCGAMSVLMILVHHLYLRMRRRGARKAMAAGLLYPAAGVAGMWIYMYVIFPEGGFSANLFVWGVAEGAFAWTALVVAARLAERKEVA